ncbi:Frag1/DRAM/Sfk1 family-domain-containing protein [Cristinia sonorae]|uniref:Frag1/DRAM/Sfk1 family-domain-containing protein n=1 Tax=Cristinia sonorae TaxID=1940300 RepID=A0A8K0UNR6_9AGAR|nr:Frag1/DRAM/Sfk1 family-domain-containing protein [Cristinia sonorae]
MSVSSNRLSVVVDATHIATLHTFLSLGAFLSALFIATSLHYKQIVKNGVAGYPDEWFPSVSATIGDWYPERSIFHILIALNSGPRFILVLLQYHLQRSTGYNRAGFLLGTGLLRTLACGGWVYISSTDDHDWHDILMIVYLVLNIPWMFGGIAATQAAHALARRRRKLYAYSFFTAILPMVHFFIQHKVHHIPGAYTKYSIFEWSLIILDIMYDSVVAQDLKAVNLQVAVGVLGGDQDIPVPEKIPAPEIPRISPITLLFTQSALPLVGENLYSQLSPAVDFLCDVYLSYVNWSVFTSLTPTLFYFSVWKLGVAGHELSLLSTLSPLLLRYPIVLDISASRAGRTILYALTAMGIAAYALSSPLLRLLVVMIANAALCVGFAADWSAPPVSASYQGLLTGIGFLLCSLSKHANHTNNPIWPIVHEKSGGYNKTGLVLAGLAIYNYRSRSPREPESANKKSDDPAAHNAAAPTPMRQHWFLDSFALGSLIFSLHSLLGDSSTLIAASWTGYPIKGPVPHLHGSLTHVAQAIGLALPIALTTLSPGSTALSSPLWFVYGCVSTVVMYSYEDWTGYIGGLNLAVFLMSIIPTVMVRAAFSSASVAKTYATAFFIVSLYYVGSVFTVAYAFVPGGQYFRERTNWVLAVQLLGLASAFKWPGMSAPAPRLIIPSSLRSRISNTIVGITILSLVVTMYRWPTTVVKPYRPGPRIVRAGIWTVHFGIDDEGRDSQRRMRDLVRDMEVDVLGLLETDLHRPVFGNRDLTRVLVEELGYYVDIGPGPNKHTWGAVLLSKFPILRSTHHLLPSPEGELAPAIQAVLDVYGEEVNVLVVHNGQEETPLDRELQSKEVGRIMGELYPQPTIFLGYLVTRPHAPRPWPYEYIMEDGKVHDIDKDDRARWCEYIAYRGFYRTSYARVSHGTITDTELQIGQFVLPKYGVGVTHDSEGDRYMRAWKEDLPPIHWFPKEYMPTEGGVNGHQYDKWGTPMYYKIPEGAVL